MRGAPACLPPARPLHTHPLLTHPLPTAGVVFLGVAAACVGLALCVPVIDALERARTANRRRPRGGDGIAH